MCLAAFAASAISRADPIKTGVQSFIYDIRTAILPFVFVFNPQLLLIGVNSFWHGLSIFFIALLAIFSFSSAVQGWMLIKTRWYEGLILLVASWMLFLPNAALNQVSPEFVTSDMNTFIASEVVLQDSQKVRLHVTRHTEYGERYKLFVFSPETNLVGAEQLGLELVQEDEQWLVSNMAFMGLAEKSGIDFYDEITAMDVQSLQRPSLLWVYGLAMLLIVLVIGSQWIRSKRQHVGGINA